MCFKSERAAFTAPECNLNAAISIAELFFFIQTYVLFSGVHIVIAATLIISFVSKVYTNNEFPNRTTERNQFSSHRKT